MKSLSQLIGERVSQTLPILPEKPTKELSVRCNKLLAIYPEKRDFLTNFNFDTCLQKFQDFNTPEKALVSKKMKLREVALSYDNQTPISMIEFWLINLSAYLSIEATDQQIREIAIYLYEDNSFFNLAELTLFFKRLKKGFYGELYGRFDGMKIVSAAREYRYQRGLILSRLTEEEQKDII